MLSVEGFRPAPKGTVNLSASSSSTTSALLRPVSNTNIACRVFNSAAVTAFVDFGDANTTASTTGSIPFPAGALEVMNIDQSAYAAVILASGTGTVYFTTGYGL